MAWCRQTTSHYLGQCWTGSLSSYGVTRSQWINTLRPRQNGRLFADDTFKRIFLNENVGISIKISLKFVHKGPINNIPALVQIMAWRRPGDKPLSEPMVVRLPTHICITRPQWVKTQQNVKHAQKTCYWLHLSVFFITNTLFNAPHGPIVFIRIKSQSQ